MKTVTARARLDAAMTEAQLQATVTSALTRCGWWSYHTHDARRSERGFPDLFAIRGDRMLFAELKTEAGRVSAAQHAVLALLRTIADVVNTATGRATITVAVWRPSDLDEALQVIARR